VASRDPPRTLRWLSTGSGLLLIIGGIAGGFTINPLAMVISIYNVLYGALIVLTELKTWPVIRTFQRRVDVYFHLRSVPRGKGGFYCFIGFLAFFSSDWGLARVCILIVSIVGVLHVLACKRCGARDEEEREAAIAPSQLNSSSVEFVTASGSCTSGPSDWAGIMKQVVAESPEVLTAGLAYASSAAVTPCTASSASAAAIDSSGTGASRPADGAVCGAETQAGNAAASADGSAMEGGLSEALGNDTDGRH
jgi:hypothetical protein